MILQRLPLGRATIARRWFSSSNNKTVAIVGSGPSGCYTAKYLLNHDNVASVHVLDKLPTPFGLVRSGVAPDHQLVKNVQNDFSELFNADEKGNKERDVELYANVTVGKDVSLEELRKIYDVVVLAYGCENNRKLGIPGEEDLQGVLSAREFVAWYNGHPDYFDMEDPLKKNNVKNVVVIGQGNVAIDCARILRKGMEGLKDTDIVQHALSSLDSRSDIAVSIIGRRGHVQGAFTIKEIRELSKLPGFFVSEEELDMSMPTSEPSEPLPRPKQRIDKLLREAAATTDPETKIALRFFWNPVRFRGDRKGCLSAVVCERTRLDEDGRAVGTGQFMSLDADLALVSVGYKGVAIPGLEDFFSSDEGRVMNTHGKVDDGTEDLGGLYVSGWLKRGPSGIIGTNIADAKDTVESIVKDLASGTTKKESSVSSLKDLLESREVKIVDWKSYQRIDGVERSPERVRTPIQPREKLPSYPELLEAAFGK